MTSDTTAVVLGGGIAGLLAAAAMHRHVSRVVVVDRDDPRAAGRDRTRHGVTTGGLTALERLLPGLTADLVARDALAGPTTTVCWRVDGLALATGPSGAHGVLVHRGRLDDAVRARVAALPGVELLPGHDVAGLVVDAGRVTGARVVPRGTAGTPGPIEAGLVVDATGRGSRTPEWLAGWGLATPAQETLAVGLTYRTYRFPAAPGALPGPALGTPPSRRHRYERCPLPPGLAVVGDALCAVNPVYGQGITVAALQAEALGGCLAAGLGPDAGRRAAREAARIAEASWVTARGVDGPLPPLPRAPLPRRLADRRLARLLSAAERDEALAGAVLGTVLRHDPPAARLAVRAARVRPRPHPAAALPGTPLPI